MNLPVQTDAIARTKKILLVDDEVDIVTSCHLVLTRAGYVAYDASSVEAACELARRERPDLILCDINMPNGGGRELLKQIRNDFGSASIQFVFMTGDSFEMPLGRAIELGADDVLTKPFSLAELCRCVAARLDRTSPAGG